MKRIVMGTVLAITSYWLYYWWGPGSKQRREEDMRYAYSTEARLKVYGG